MIKKNTQKNLICFLLIFFCLLNISGCSKNEQTRTDKLAASGEIASLTIGTTMKLENINTEDYYFGILRGILTHKGLVKLTENGEISGDLAENWSSPDSLIWTFTLPEGVTWHDGQPLTAADIKFTLEYNMSKSIEYRSHFSLIKSIDAPDNKTLVLTLTQPCPRFLYSLLVLRILPAHIFAQIENPSQFNEPQAAIGCGPYIFQSFDPQSGLLIFKANNHYYHGSPPVREIRVRLFKNPDAMYMALHNGEIDLPYSYAAGTDPIYNISLSKNKHLTSMQIPNTGVSKSLIFNTAKTPVNDSVVRNALAYAINYPEIVGLFAAANGAVPTAGFVPANTPGYQPTNSLEYKPEKACQILEQNGYFVNASGIREKNGQTLTFELTLRNDIPENIRIAELLQKYFSAIGVKMQLKLVDSTLYRTISEKDKSYTCLLVRTTPWGMMMWAGMGTGYMDARNIGWAMVSDSSFYQLVDSMNKSINKLEYYQQAAALQQYYATNLPAIALYWDDFIQPYNASLSGWKISPTYGILNEETWYNLKRN